jgi:hypothetical protein
MGIEIYAERVQITTTCSLIYRPKHATEIVGNDNSGKPSTVAKPRDLKELLVLV